MKLTTLKPRVATLQPRLVRAVTRSEQRMAGRKLQERRKRMWSADPFCAKCAKLTAWPNGFELDHVTRLDQGGKDIEANCQILCVEWIDGQKAGCHVEKTKHEGRPHP